MKIIFVDIEGVLISLAAQRLGDQADPACVARLNSLAAEAQAALVVSSTWRSQDPDELTALLKTWGVTALIAGVTDDLSYLDLTSPIGIRRGDEISQWLDAHPEVDDFVILDDDDDMGSLRPYLVQTETDQGLTDDQATRAALLLRAVSL